ncbi:hypothetical protein, partial [Burkholderia anthina]|uniref:hypothetical protein n=1 Tax=Burkholderia anthina TaxID=179879 RepID=UPI001E367EDC
GLDANSTGKILVNDALLELLVVLRHEKHPKGWTGVQLLGCSSKPGQYRSMRIARFLAFSMSNDVPRHP